MSRFSRATKTKSKIRIALYAPAGAGKTFTALSIAKALSGDSVAVIDTERGRASKYSDRFTFDVCELANFSPDDYIDVIREAEESYGTIIIDSLSHAWMGKGGALEMADLAGQKERGNKFAGWRHVTPKHNELVEALMTSPAHIISTMRSKTEYVIEEDDRGKKVPRRVGLAAVQRDGMEYEFDFVGTLDRDHSLYVEKSIVTTVPDSRIYTKPGEEFGQLFVDWINEGAEPAHRETPAELADKHMKMLADASTEDEVQAIITNVIGPAWPAGRHLVERGLVASASKDAFKRVRAATAKAAE